MNAPASTNDAEKALWIRQQMPSGGLFAGLEWRVAVEPFRLGEERAGEIEKLGRVLLQFYKAVNLLYRQSVEGRQPAWVAHWLDQGKPASLIALQRDAAFKNELPRVIRPDLLLEENGFAISELDSVPGGIGLTAWLNQTYAALPGQPPEANTAVLGGASGMREGFISLFGDAARVHIVVSEEAATYRPEMEWLCHELGGDRFQVRDGQFMDFQPGDAVYRFFELFDVANVPNAQRIFQLASEKQIQLTPPPKPLFEEKMVFALLWNRNLDDFWRRELGAGFFERMRALVPRTWLLDPTPLPPHGAIPELNLTDWRQLKQLSQRERDLILKVSGFSERAWGARGVWLGSDLSLADWSQAVEEALTGFEHSPCVLQRYRKPTRVPFSWYDFHHNQTAAMEGRVRLCPYYFVSGQGDGARARLGGAMATVCPADKKIIHGMTDAVIAPCTL
jgi:hypothetical protein